MNRKDQILDAAEQCMRLKGFHQTSIQNIASQANISVGLIYKYFTNKESIIEALVLNVVQRLKDMLKKDLEQIATSDVQQHLPLISADLVPSELENSIVLLMEVSSEAMRNARIKAILSDAWQTLKDNFIAQEKSLYPNKDASVIQTRLYVLSMIIDGIIIRRCMKKREIIPAFVPFFDGIINEVNINVAQQ
ncbi:TetR/AcrR family transcriptional regulator [Pantoea sp. At-9b]|uniref:TetR/AcrR family transcriptional regulator n=1 Tax=Pantoea sp. (strain At-9b) TaxID=592316 RepID=UPI0001B3EE69|nr:TetR/AcrR family transcriptional regulator [Pantoea sp. At-9b]ADU69158.1 transcriptional regulator, TetR family [Pantoea sp. At-9b]